MLSTESIEKLRKAITKRITKKFLNLMWKGLMMKIIDTKELS